MKVKYVNFDHELHELEGENVSCKLCGEELELVESSAVGNHSLFTIPECTCDELVDYLDIQSQIDTLKDQIKDLEKTKPTPNVAAKNNKKYQRELAKLKKKYNQE